ncbi:MAG: hypothetical protein RSA20_09675, partial [Oscillospiraceae bacterium]
KETIPGTLPYAKKINEYVVGEVVAVDGESTTYLAFDTTSQRRVLLKEFLPVSMVGARQGDDITIQQDKQVLFKNLLFDFVEMYDTLKNIDSPAMPKIFDVFLANKTAYAIIENVQGATLRQTLIKRGKPFSFKEARWLFDGLFQLLAKMSNLNLSHGGISDETVIITPDNTIVLTGFAIQDLRAKNDHIMYKLYDGFSAPEQYSQNRFQGFFTDIYSLACLLYFAVTGSVLTQGALDTKDIYRIFPKYAVEALKYATKDSPVDRIDNIGDFILMLDDKAVMEKQMTKAVPIKELDKKKLAQYTLLAVCFVLVLVVAFNSIGKDKKGNSSSQSEYSSIVVEKLVPYLTGKRYTEVINNKDYQQDFLFIKQEEYSSKVALGEIISHTPEAG